jgi:hypothetical protein
MLRTRRMTSGIAINLDRRRERWLTMLTTANAEPGLDELSDAPNL